MKDEPAGPILDIQDLSIDIDDARVVDGFSLKIGRGEIVALVGESGCGKSQTAMALLRLLPKGASMPGGRILLKGTDMAVLSERAMRRLRGESISVIFQEPTASLDPLATVGSQIEEALCIHRPVSGSAARKAAIEMLNSVGIPDPERRMGQYPFELSGGMCQRIMIAIALICEPLVLIADEPTTALDVTIQAQILDLMRNLVSARGTSILLITHDMGVVAATAHRVVVMYAGRIAEIASVDALFHAPAHPYTAMLLASVPRLDATPKRHLATIDGLVPSPFEFPLGCRFAGRCPLTRERCHEEAPPLAPPPPTFPDAERLTACWYADEVPSIRERANG